MHPLEYAHDGTIRWHKINALDAVVGWRPVPKSQRERKLFFTKPFTPRDELLGFLDDLVRLIEESDNLVQNTHVEKAQRLDRSWASCSAA